MPVSGLFRCFVIMPWAARALLVLCSALCDIPSTAKAQTADQMSAAGHRRGAACSAARPAAQKPNVRSRLPGRRRDRPRPTTTAVSVANAGKVLPRAPHAANLYQAPTGQTRDHDRSKPVRQQAGVTGRRRVARQPRHLREAGQRAARSRHLDPRLQRPQRLWHPQSRDLRRRLPGHAAGRAFPQRPDRSARLWRDRCHQGPSSALYGNYATGGALNFRTRPGGTIDGVEYGVDGGSFGYLSNYLAAGKKVGNFEGSLFAQRCARRRIYPATAGSIPRPSNFLGTLAGDARRPLHGQVHQQRSRAPAFRSGLSLNQFYQNPVPAGLRTGCDGVRRAADRCRCSTTASTRAAERRSHGGAGGTWPQ